eukprot:TRINITY_DN14363_c0_g1_i1.p1 TRINITY_DN14363_c0_g1~~TRINITY_DN14363_c0_g1_i1.p1  ORF type:complete len:160 (-),score=38.85 TRINITY_DN14363_c0_g1_i1:138-617(-)
MGFSIISIVLAVILLICQLIIGMLWVAGYPVSKTMEDPDGDENDSSRGGDQARYYYTIGLLLVFFNILSLIISAVPVKIVKSIGCALAIAFGLMWLFIATQVQLQSASNLQYPNCDDAPNDRQCAGYKINFVCTVFLMVINAFQVAYGAAFISDKGEDK